MTRPTAHYRAIRPQGAGHYDVVVRDMVIGRIVERTEPGLNDRGPRNVIRGIFERTVTDSFRESRTFEAETMPANDVKHAAQMVFNGWLHSLSDAKIDELIQLEEQAINALSQRDSIGVADEISRRSLALLYPLRRARAGRVTGRRTTGPVYRAPTPTQPAPVSQAVIDGEGEWAMIGDGKWGVRLSHRNQAVPGKSGRTVRVRSRSGKAQTVRLGRAVDNRSYCTIYEVAR